MKKSNNEWCNDPKCEITREGIPHNHTKISKSPILSNNISDFFIYVNGDIRSKSRELLGRIKYRYSTEDYALYNVEGIKLLSVKFSWFSFHKWKVSLDYEDMTMIQIDKNKSSTFTLKNKKGEIILKGNFEGNDGEILTKDDILIVKSMELKQYGVVPIIQYQIINDIKERDILLGMLACQYTVFIVPYERQEGF